MVMGDTLESTLRQTLGRSEGSFMPFIERPISAALVATALLLLLWPLVSGLFAKRQATT
jgi:putative tricarboxylic transport membrane protein